MSEQPGQGDGTSGRDTATAPGKGPARPGEATRSVWRTLWLGIAAFVASTFLYPVGLVLAVVALVVGIRTSRRPATDRPNGPIVGGLVLGSLALLIAGAQLVLSVIIWPETSRYQQCLNSANTTTDESVCKDRYITEIERKFGWPAGRLSGVRDLI